MCEGRPITVNFRLKKRQFVRMSPPGVIVMRNGRVESKCLAPILPGQFKFQK